MCDTKVSNTEHLASLREQRLKAENEERALVHRQEFQVEVKDLLQAISAASEPKPNWKLKKQSGRVPKVS